MVWPRPRPTATAKEAAEEDTAEEGTRAAMVDITARERLRPNQGMVAMEDILAAMAGAMAEVMDLTVVAMAATLEATAAMEEDTPGEAMVTAKERRSQDTAPMEVATGVAMEVAMEAIALDMDLMEEDMVATPEAADLMAEVTATGGNYLALDTKKTIQLFKLS